MPPAFRARHQVHEQNSREPGPGSGARYCNYHARCHGRGYCKAAHHEPARQRVAHNEGSQRTRYKACRERQLRSITRMMRMGPFDRTQNQEAANQRYEYAAGQLKLRRPPLEQLPGPHLLRRAALPFLLSAANAWIIWRAIKPAPIIRCLLGLTREIQFLSSLLMCRIACSRASMPELYSVDFRAPSRGRSSRRGAAVNHHEEPPPAISMR